MSKIDTFNAMKDKLATAERWAAMIGRKYHGGGGGYGEVRSVDASAVIYCQPNDGDTNYHEMPACLRPHFEAVILNHAETHIAAAVERLRGEVRKSADNAAEEARAVLSATSAPAPQPDEENRK